MNYELLELKNSALKTKIIQIIVIKKSKSEEKVIIFDGLRLLENQTIRIDCAVPLLVRHQRIILDRHTTAESLKIGNEQNERIDTCTNSMNK